MAIKKRVRLAIRRSFYLGPLWTILAEILGDNSPIVGLSCVQISLGCDEARGSSGRKRPKNYTSINKKMGRFAKRRGPKNAGTVWSWGRPSSWFIYNPRTTLGANFIVRHLNLRLIRIWPHVRRCSRSLVASFPFTQPGTCLTNVYCLV